MRYVICIDLGGTKLKAAILRAEVGASLNPEIIYETEQVTKKKSSKTVVDQLKSVIQDCISHADSIVDAISIGVPGLVDHEKQSVVVCPNLPIKDLQLKREMEKAFSIRTIVDNDANIATLGEKYFGEGRGVKNFICITIGTGIGGGIVLNDRIYRGETGGAGEFGHMILDSHGPMCTCGVHGCFERYASGTAIAEHATNMLKDDKYKGSCLHDLIKAGKKIETEDVVEAARMKDKLGLDVIKFVAEMTAIACANLVNILDPKMIIFFGGVLKAGDLLFKPMKESIENMILGQRSRQIMIRKAALLNKAAVLGAYALYIEETVANDESQIQGSYY